MREHARGLHGQSAITCNARRVSTHLEGALETDNIFCYMLLCSGTIHFSHPWQNECCSVLAHDDYLLTHPRHGANGHVNERNPRGRSIDHIRENLEEI